MRYCFRSCFGDAPSRTVTSQPEDIGLAPKECVTVPVKALKLQQRRLLKPAVESLLLSNASSWRERINALAGDDQIVVSLFIYATGGSHAVVVHSAGHAAHRLPPGLVDGATIGFSHAFVLNGKKPVVHTPCTPLKPLPYDWRLLAGYEDADSLVLLPLRRSDQVYGSVLICAGPAGAPAKVAASGKPDKSAPQDAYDMDELEQLSQYLSVGLLTIPELQVLQLVANASANLQQALTVQDAVSCLSEATQSCLRLLTRLELECLPAVAFPTFQVAAFFRFQTRPPSQLPAAGALDGTAAVQSASCSQYLQAGAATASRSNSRTRGPPHDDPPPALCLGSLAASLAASMPLGGPADAAAADLRDAADAVPSHPQAALQRPSFMSALASRLRSAPYAQASWLQAGGHGRDSSDLPRGLNSVPLPPVPGGGGVRVHATMTPLHQTLLGQHLDIACASGSGGGSGAGGIVTIGSNSLRVQAASRAAAAAGRVLPPGSSEAVTVLLDGGGGVGCSHGGAAAAGCEASRSLSQAMSIAIVPNCASFLMADERQPYKDVLHVQRALPHMRAHSLVMVLSVERCQDGDHACGGSQFTGNAQLLRQTQQPSQRSQAKQLRLPASQMSMQQQPQQQQRRAMTAQPIRPASCATPAPLTSTPAGVRMTVEDGAAIGHGVCSEPYNGRSPQPTCGGYSAGNRFLQPTPAAAAMIHQRNLCDAPTFSSSSGPVPASLILQGPGSVAYATHALANTPSPLALYLVAAESVPRVILEQVAEEAKLLMMILHRPFASALRGPTLAMEWMRFKTLLVTKLTSGTTTGSTITGIGFGASNSSIRASSQPVSPGPTLSCNHHCHPYGTSHSSNHRHPPSQQDPVGPVMSVGQQDSAINPTSFLLRFANTQGSADTDEMTSISVALDTTNPTTGTLSMLISSMRDVLSTVQLERSPEFRSPAQEDIYAVRLLKVAGRGGQGMVFQGQMYNATVAVKIIPSSEDADPTAMAMSTAAPGAGGGADPLRLLHGICPAAAAAAAGARAAGGGDAGERLGPNAVLKLQQRQKRWLVRDALEVAVTSTISHPHIVQVLNFFTDALMVEYSNEHSMYRLMPKEDAPYAKGCTNTAIVMEYCDAGTLKHAVDGGCFKVSSAPSGAGDAAICATQPLPYGLNMLALLTSLLEVAAGLRHLHEHKLVHCDVKPSNVLLRSCASDVRGWTCKLSDFGCVRLLNEVDPHTGRAAFHSLSPIGSISYMSPESMCRDTYLDASVDIYSFGIMMWECVMCQLPYTGVPVQQLPSLVRRGMRPSFHPDVPPDYRHVACLCWSQDALRRPSAAALVQLLQRLLNISLDDHPSEPLTSPIALAPPPSPLEQQQQ